MFSNHIKLSRDTSACAALPVLVDDSNFGGYYMICPVEGCQHETPRENFQGSARLRLGEHLDEEMRKEF